MSLRVYVPCDAAALSVGADAVARAIADEIVSRRLDLAVVRNGSRGLFWLEPLVEVETPRGRIAYGSVTADAVAGLFDRGFHDGKPHPLGHGLTEEIPYLNKQERLTFSAVRHYRLAIAGGLCQPRRLQRPRAGARHGVGVDRR